MKLILVGLGLVAFLFAIGFAYLAIKVGHPAGVGYELEALLALIAAIAGFGFGLMADRLER